MDTPDRLPCTCAPYQRACPACRAWHRTHPRPRPGRTRRVPTREPHARSCDAHPEFQRGCLGCQSRNRAYQARRNAPTPRDG
jgi:hypothetical protein